MDNPSTWDELYDKTKAARRRHWNFIGRKQGDNIEIFCAASTARLTRNRVGGIVECLCHAAGILRGHQVLHHVADGSAHRKLVFGDGELLRGPAFHTTLSQTKAPLGAVRNAATQQVLSWYCDYQLIDRLSWLLKQLF